MPISPATSMLSRQQRAPALRNSFNTAALHATKGRVGVPRTGSLASSRITEGDGSQTIDKEAVDVTKDPEISTSSGREPCATSLRHPLIFMMVGAALPLGVRSSGHACRWLTLERTRTRATCRSLFSKA